MLIQECPSGVVNEDTFKYIYAQFFPQGGTFSLDLLRAVGNFSSFNYLRGYLLVAKQFQLAVIFLPFLRLSFNTTD